MTEGNIFLDSEHNIRLGDFGLATRNRKRDAEASSGQNKTSETIQFPEDETNDTITGGVGTTFYIAPEQAGHGIHAGNEKTEYDTKADIFSLGIVVFGKVHQEFLCTIDSNIY